ncbi:MAG: hypothetical protein JWM68_1794 [Verrucomicrobiales bacterium]|nr:hypothetical protein [Verrucomicrobiales bacterium]
MSISPIIQHDLRMALRRNDPVRARLIAAAATGGLSFLFLLFGLMTRTWGTQLFHYLFLACLFLVILRPAQIALGIVSEERRNQTLELLFLTGMTPAEFFRGKVLGATLVASCELLAVAPFLAVPFVAGGLSVDLYVASLVCLPTILLFIISVSILASVICNDDTMALMTTVVLVVIISGVTTVPFFLGKLLTGATPFSEGWLFLSPGYGALMVGSQFSIGSVAAFWPTAICTWLWTILCFCVAAVVLSRTWRNDPDARVLQNWRQKWQTLVRGTAAWRSYLRIVTLTRNPYQWLAQRDRRPVLTAWGIILFLCVVWFIGWALWPRNWPSTMNFFLTAVLMIIALETVISHTAARRIGHDRRDGFLELLLTTPLSPIEIVEGQMAAIREQFQPVRRGILALCGLMMVGGFLTRSWDSLAIITYLMVWGVFFVWCARNGTQKVSLIMWIALNTGRPSYAAFRSKGGAFFWFWMFFQFRNLRFGGLGTFPTGTVTECAVVGFAVAAMIIFMIVVDRDRSDMSFEFSQKLRSIAQDPVPDPHDPRYKKWKNVRDPFPPADPKPRPRLADLLGPNTLS